MSVDIVIPNYNGREALELCVESIARFTPEPHRVIVCDDGSTYQGDLEYQERAVDNGTVNVLVRRTYHCGHGGILNVLLNEGWVTSNYVAVIDNDIQILRAGWLRDLLILADAPNVLAVCDHKDTLGYCSRGYRPGMFMFWFGLINMTAYRDGMCVDWATEYADRGAEPWRTLFAPYHPPEQNDVFRRLRETQWEYRADFNADRVVFDPGAALWAKLKFDNPKGYVSRPLTPALRQSFRHWGHGQNWLDDANANSLRGAALRQQIQTELKRLREGK